MKPRWWSALALVALGLYGAASYAAASGEVEARITALARSRASRAAATAAARAAVLRQIDRDAEGLLAAQDAYRVALAFLVSAERSDRQSDCLRYADASNYAAGQLATQIAKRGGWSSDDARGRFPVDPEILGMDELVMDDDLAATGARVAHRAAHLRLLRRLRPGETPPPPPAEPTFAEEQEARLRKIRAYLASRKA